MWLWLQNGGKIDMATVLIVPWFSTHFSNEYIICFHWALVLRKYYSVIHISNSAHKLLLISVLHSFLKEMGDYGLWTAPYVREMQQWCLIQRVIVIFRVLTLPYWFMGRWRRWSGIFNLDALLVQSAPSLEHKECRQNKIVAAISEFTYYTMGQCFTKW